MGNGCYKRHVILLFGNHLLSWQSSPLTSQFRGREVSLAQDCGVPLRLPYLNLSVQIRRWLSRGLRLSCDGDSKSGEWGIETGRGIIESHTCFAPDNANWPSPRVWSPSHPAGVCTSDGHGGKSSRNRNQEPAVPGDPAHIGCRSLHTVVPTGFLAIQIRILGQ